MTLNDWLGRRRLYTPDRVGVVDDADDRRRYTYAELDDRATRVAAHLQTRFHVEAGQRVAVLATNRIEYLDLYFACGKIGAILAPLNYRLPAAGLAEVLADCRPAVLAFESSLAESARKAAKTLGDVALWPVHDAKLAASEPSVAEIASSPGRDDIHLFSAAESDTAMILYTSGTTGRAKGAMISYRQIHWNALNTIIGLGLTENDAAFLNMPLYHTGGWHVLFTPLVLLGGRSILQPRFDAEQCNELLGPEEITILFGVPTTLRMMSEAANFAAADFSTVRFAIFGGESCPLPVIETYARRGVGMRQGYGLTEAGPNCFSLPAADSLRKQGSIGLPNFHVEARLLQKDGRPAASGEVGELHMRGPHVFSGYWNNATATAEVLRDGWLATGDLMTRDEDGYYYVVGRTKEMYVSGGENVYPAQVERVLQAHPAVASAAVIGVADPHWGEVGWAFIESPPGSQPPTAAELTAWCKERLASFQCPKEFVILAELPKGPSGKIDKQALRTLRPGDKAV